MACLYILYKQHNENWELFIPPSAVDRGDLLIEELNMWVFTTWKTPARLTDIFQDNPDLLQRVQVKSKSGSKYYKYRLHENFTPMLIVEKPLREFFDAITVDYVPRVQLPKEQCPHGIPKFVKCPYCI